MEHARLLGNAPIANGWRILRVETGFAAALEPGHWLELAGVRLPVLTASANVATLLAAPGHPDLEPLQPHQRYALSGPLGTVWPLPADEPAVLVGSGASIASVLFLSERLTPALVLLEGNPPPFRPAPSEFMVPGVPPHVIGAAPMLEARQIPSRVASPAGLPGCLEADAAELYAAIQPHYAKAPVYAGAPAPLLARLAAPALWTSTPPV